MLGADRGARPSRTTPQCVRCGRAPRYDGTFVCCACKYDPARLREQRAVAFKSGEPLPYDLQRRELIRRFHWAGGWPRA